MGAALTPLHHALRGEGIIFAASTNFSRDIMSLLSMFVLKRLEKETSRKSNVVMNENENEIIKLLT